MRWSDVSPLDTKFFDVPNQNSRDHKMSYLSEFHPELFLTSPRPGGIANILTPEEIAAGAGEKRQASSRTTLISSRSARSTATNKSIFDPPAITSTPVSKEFRIKTVTTASPWILFAEEEETENPETVNPIHDTMMILAITISTIMLMAAGHADISQDHLKWTLSYLENIKDEYGNNPPNIRGMINNIKMMDESISSFNE